jgi:cellulose biosynthesis protein BcsQ
VNRKGGCGKTITSINLAAFLAREQRRVLLVDMDPQGHATLGLLSDAVHPSRNMYEVFVEEPGECRPGGHPFDCPPSVGVLTFNALKACSEAIVPVDPSFFGLHYQALANEVLRQQAARAENGSLAIEGDAIPMRSGADWPEPSAPAVTAKEVVFAIEAPPDRAGGYGG